MSTYVFEKPLIRGTMLKRKSQFTALVYIDGEELIAHIPTTNRIGDVENKNLPCLLSYHDDPKRKLKYDIEACGDGSIDVKERYIRPSKAPYFRAFRASDRQRRSADLTAKIALSEHINRSGGRVE